MTDEDTLRVAGEAIALADAMLIGAGAGMGVDSGLPDFRGDRGFWKAYPPYEKLGLSFVGLANPQWFRDDPELAWGFYGHRLHLYRTTQPHSGFQILRRWASRMKHGYFVYTSNIDGHFQRAGFDEDRIVEVHGSLRCLQCMNPGCGSGLIPVPPSGPSPVTVDEQSMRAVPPLPACPACNSLVRPNVLMFGDGGWDENRSWQQEQRFNRWLQELRGARLVLVECGAGTAIPSVRHLCERVAREHNGKLIRLNPREPEVPQGHSGLPLGALAGLQALDIASGLR